MPWKSDDVACPEPPPEVLVVTDSGGRIADRTETPCDYCGPPGNIWRWRHNGGTECWLEMDGIGPWKEVPSQL